MKTDTGFQAVVMAADRGPDDAVKLAAGAPCKAFAPVRGMPMILRVLDALEASSLVDSIFVVGPAQELLSRCPELMQRLEDGRVTWLESHEHLADSVAASLGQLHPDLPVFMTTADHALLSVDIIDDFLSVARDTDADAAIGMVSYTAISSTYPAARRTVTRFRDGGYCGSNLYAMKAQSARRLVDWWRRSAEDRKQPAMVMLQLLGPRMALSYLFGRLSLEQAMAGIGKRIGVRVRAVVLSNPDAGIDVDTPLDLELVETILAAKQGLA